MMRGRTEHRARTGAARRGQAWSLDYTAGLLLFLFTFMLVLSTLLRTVLIPDTFGDVMRSGDAVSEQLMSTGYPESWRPADIVTAGLLTQDELSLRKAERLADLSAQDYQKAKNSLNTKYDYAVTLAERNGTLVPMGTWCRIGNGTEQKTVVDATLPAAYYGAGSLDDALAAANATLFGQANLSGLLASRRSFDLIVLEQPDLSSAGQPYDAQKAAFLEDFALRGGTLLLVGNVNLTELLGLNITPINGTANASGAGTDTLLNLSGLTLSNVTGFTLTPSGQERYEPLASLTDGSGRDFAAHFTYGDGDVYFIGGLVGSINESLTIEERVEEGLNRTLLRSVAQCAAVSPPPDVRNLVTTKRLAAYRGRILTMTVMVWEPR